MGMLGRLRSAITLMAACAAVAGCARVPALRSVLATHYAGYDQVLPASEALPNEKRYEYLPGNIAAFTLSADLDPAQNFDLVRLELQIGLGFLQMQRAAQRQVEIVDYEHRMLPPRPQLRQCNIGRAIIRLAAPGRRGDEISRRAGRYWP
jgi:hypothetical protein